MASQQVDRTAPFGVVLTLTFTAALAAFLLLAAPALLVLPGKDLPAPLADQHQSAETLLFLTAFAVVLPLSAWLIPGLADRIAVAQGPAAASALAAALASALLGALLLVKLSERLPWGGGLGVLAAAMGTYCVSFGLLLRRAARQPRWPPLAGGARHLGPAWLLAAGLLLALPLAFARLGSIALVPLLIAAAAAILLIALRERTPALPPAWGRVADVGIAALILLAVPNLVVIHTGDPAAAFETPIIQFHQNFFLGPAAQVTGGGAMLVDTLSQYGVGSIYLIAGWFELTAVSNGMLGLLEGILAAAMFAGAFVVLRLAGVDRVLAGVTMLVALIVLVYGLLYPIGGLLQHGAIRFGPPMALLLAGVIEARRPSRATVPRLAAAIVVGLSSIWALEAFAYTLLTAAGILAALTWLQPAGGRRRFLARRAAEIAASCVTAHLLFAALTLAAAGELPDWGLYLTTLREFLAGPIGDLTYDFSPWSPGVALGAIYLGSGIAVVLVIRRLGDFARTQAVTLVALAGATAYGVALLSYLVNRSGDHIVPYASLPAMMVVALWLSLLVRSPGLASASLRRAGLGLTLAVSALMVAVAWSSVGERFAESALAHAPPGGRSLRGAIDRLENFPPISPGVEETEALLRQEMPDESRSLIVVTPDLGVEALARSGRTSLLPLSDPWEDSFVPDQHLDPIADAVDGLEAGDRILLDGYAADAFERYREDPSLEPSLDELEPSTRPTVVPTGMSILQVWALDRIGNEFRLRPVARGTGPEGLVVAELVADPAPA